MGFNAIPITRNLHGRDKLTNTVRVGINRNGSKYQARLVIARDVADLLAYNKGTRVALLWGDGADKGKLLITPSNAPESYKLTSNSHSLYLQAQRFPADMQQSKFPTTDCRFTVHGRDILVTLPVWFYGRTVGQGQDAPDHFNHLAAE